MKKDKEIIKKYIKEHGKYKSKHGIIRFIFLNNIYLRDPVEGINFHMSIKQFIQENNIK